jgi:hypothetical protein
METSNMKINIPLTLIILLGLICSCNSGTEKTDNIKETYWTLEKAKKLASDFNSPEKWNNKTLKMEVENLEKYPPSDIPLYVSPFPTPKYSSPGNGNGPIATEIGGKKIIGHNVIIGKSEYSEHLFKNADDKKVTYFTILAIGDGKETENPVSATSRNHPHYLSQGSLNILTNSRVDWIATQLADKNAYAIVNSRIFDLRVGRLILVAPQKDGSIRFYQTDAPVMNSNERKKYIENLKTDQKAIDFFKDENSIG